MANDIKNACVVTESYISWYLRKRVASTYPCAVSYFILQGNYFISHLLLYQTLQIQVNHMVQMSAEAHNWCLLATLSADQQFPV